MITLTNRQARQFLLLKHGLLGEHTFAGKQGVLDFVRQTGCIQFDPIDICGKNAEITLQSRVKGFKKTMLEDLLYRDRALVDYPDKNTAIILTEDWPHFARYRQAARDRAGEHPELLALMAQVLDFVRARGVASPNDLRLESDFQWRAFIVWSSGKNLTSSVMEQLYGAGDLIIHHKEDARKFYAPAADHLPAEVLHAPDLLPEDMAHKKWRLLRQIGAVGLMFNRQSDAFPRYNTAERNELFDALQREGSLLAATVEGRQKPLFFRAGDMPLMEAVLRDPTPKPRCEVIATLDPFLWDRGLIRALFHFAYSWEIYTPAAQRKYGHYVLPLLYGERFIGRVEAVADRKAGVLTVKNLWYEQGVRVNKRTQAAVDRCMRRFSAFNGCGEVVYEAAYAK